MGVFDTSNLSQQGGTNVSPEAGVATDKAGVATDNSALYQGVSNLVKVGATAYDAYSTNKEAARVQTGVAGIASELEAINNSIATGQLDPTIAKARKQQILLRGVQANIPVKDIKAIMGVGVGGEEDFRSVQQRTEDEAIEKANAGNAIYPYMDRTQKLAAAENFRVKEQWRQNMEDQSKQTALAQGATNLEKSQRANQSMKAVTGFAVSVAEDTKNKVSQVLFDTNQAGNTTAAVGTALEKLTIQRAELVSQINLVGSEAGGVAQSVSTSMLAQFDLAEKQLKGEITKEAYDSYTANAISFQKQLAVGNLEVQQLAAMESLFPTIVTSALKGSTTLDFFTQNKTQFRTKPVDILVSPADEAAAPGLKQKVQDNLEDTLDVGTKSLNDKSLTPQELENNKLNVSAQVNGILHSMSKHNDGNPQAFVDVVQFLADDRYYDTATNLGENLIDGEYAEQAQEALIGYGNIAIRAVAKSIEATSIGDRRVLDVATPTVKTSSKGVTVELVPKPSASLTTLQKRELQALQRRMGKVVGNLAAAGAHLEGHKNYKQWFETNYTSIFGEKLNDKAE